MYAFSNHAVVLCHVTPFVQLQQAAVLSDGVVAAYLHQAIPLLWRGVKPVHFVMYAFSNHAVVLCHVTPFVQLQQAAVLSDGVVASYLHKTIPFLWRGGKLRLTGWCSAEPQHKLLR